MLIDYKPRWWAMRSAPIWVFLSELCLSNCFNRHRSFHWIGNLKMYFVITIHMTKWLSLGKHMPKTWINQTYAIHMTSWYVWNRKFMAYTCYIMTCIWPCSSCTCTWQIPGPGISLAYENKSIYHVYSWRMIFHVNWYIPLRLVYTLYKLSESFSINQV